MHKKVPGSFGVDALNVVLILISCVLAHIAPYWLLALSYGVLGPAHYLTQISWLHDRKYFSTSTYLAPAMVTIAGVLVLPVLLGAQVPDPWFAALLLCAALAVAVAVVVSPRRRLAVGVVVALVLFALTVRFRAVALFIALLLPTVMHIFVFTGAFMVQGANRSRSVAGYVAALALIACAATFWLPLRAYADFTPSHATVVEFFQPVVDELARLGLPASSGGQLFGFLAFAYTYHYLNWFSKVNVIRWNDVPRARRKVIALVYVLLLAAYGWSFMVGFALSLVLSMLHVLLELPLNVRTFTELAGSAKHVGAVLERHPASTAALASTPRPDTHEQ